MEADPHSPFRCGAKIYRAGQANIRRGTEPPKDLPDGVSADASPSRKAKSSGYGSAGKRTKAQWPLLPKSSAVWGLIESFDPRSAVAFTDGVGGGNPGPAALVVSVEAARRHGARAINGAWCGHRTWASSAIGLALDLLDEAKWPDDQRTEICTDSKYTYGLLELGWKAKSNTELVMTLRERLEGRKVRLHWGRRARRHPRERAG